MGCYILKDARIYFHFLPAFVPRTLYFMINMKPLGDNLANGAVW